MNNNGTTNGGIDDAMDRYLDMQDAIRENRPVILKEATLSDYLARQDDIRERGILAMGSNEGLDRGGKDNGRQS